MIKLLVFDFDGTIADTKKMLLSIVKDNAELFSYKINSNFVKKFGDKPLGPTLELLGVGERVLPYLKDRIDFEFVDYADHAKPCKNLKTLKEIRKTKIVLSNSHVEFIKLALKRFGIKFFKEIYGSNGYLRKHEMFKRVIRKYKVKPREIVYVGDRAIDVELARKIGCYSVIVCNKASWSYPSEILKAKPDFVIADLGKLKKIVSYLDSI